MKHSWHLQHLMEPSTMTTTVMAHTKFHLCLPFPWKNMTMITLTINLSQKLLTQAQSFDLPHDTKWGFCSTRLKFCSFLHPHMQAFNGSWICCFLHVSLCLHLTVIWSLRSNARKNGDVMTPFSVPVNCQNILWSHQQWWRQWRLIQNSTFVCHFLGKTWRWSLHPNNLSQKLLTWAQSFGLPQDTEWGFCSTQLKLFYFLHLHMRASHGSWICCFLHVSLYLQFAMCPLLLETPFNKK